MSSTVAREDKPGSRRIARPLAALAKDGEEACVAVEVEVAEMHQPGSKNATEKTLGKTDRCGQDKEDAAGTESLVGRYEYER